MDNNSLQEKQSDSILAIVAAVSVVGWEWIARMGMGQHLGDVFLKIILFLTVFYSFPTTIRSLLGYCNIKMPIQSWVLQSDSCLYLLGLILVIIIGMLQIFLQIPFLYLLLLPGLWGGAVNLRSTLRSGYNIRYGAILLCMGSGLFYIVAVVASHLLQHPLFDLDLGYGVLRPCAWFYESAISMIQTHGITSNGLDGLPLLKYHYGAHYFIASVSSLLTISPEEGYHLLMVPFMVPFLFLSCWKLIKSFRQMLRIRTKNLTLSLFSFCLLMLILPRNLVLPGNSLNLLAATILCSIQFSFSVGISFMLISAICDWRSLGNFVPRPSHALLFVMLMCYITYSNIAVGLLACCIYGYVFLRFGLYRNRWHCLLIAITAGCVLATTQLTFSTNDLAAMEGHSSFRDHLPAYLISATGWLTVLLLLGAFHIIRTLKSCIPHSCLRSCFELFVVIHGCAILATELTTAEDYYIQYSFCFSICLLVAVVVPLFIEASKNSTVISSGWIWRGGAFFVTLTILINIFTGIRPMKEAIVMQQRFLSFDHNPDTKTFELTRAIKSGNIKDALQTLLAPDLNELKHLYPDDFRRLQEIESARKLFSLPASLRRTILLKLQPESLFLHSLQSLSNTYTIDIDKMNPMVAVSVSGIALYNAIPYYAENLAFYGYPYYDDILLDPNQRYLLSMNEFMNKYSGVKKFARVVDSKTLFADYAILATDENEN